MPVSAPWPTRRAARRALVVALLLLAAWLVVVREHTGDFRLLPSATPTRLDFLHRHYRRGEHAPVPADARRIGTSWGGGQVWGQHPAATAPTVVWVRDGSTAYVYELVGGP